jgi:hypothetical protein
MHCLSCSINSANEHMNTESGKKMIALPIDEIWMVMVVKMW